MCYLSWRASRWIETMTSDAGVRNALAEQNLERKVRVGNGYRVYFKLSRSQIEQTLGLLEQLEAMRRSESLPDIGIGHDEVIFENAIVDFKQCLIGA
jgi:hypothetical protein